MCENISCSYKDKCTSYPNWCQSCANNSGKRNYYKPEIIPWNRWTSYPIYPIVWFRFDVQYDSGKQSYYTTWDTYEFGRTYDTNTKQNYFTTNEKKEVKT